ncbi:MAG: hypothetical protein Kow0059_08750 [Candidatus Sumerlaeia bacterium]
MNNRAFTLLELFTVILMISVLAAIFVPNFLEAQVRSKMSRVVSDMAMISAALESYRVDHGFYPRQSVPLTPAEIKFQWNRLMTIGNTGLPSLYEAVLRTAGSDRFGVKHTNKPSRALAPAPGRVDESRLVDETSVLENPLIPPQAPPARLAGDPALYEAATSATLARLGLRFSPFSGNGLYALTTPVCYISAPYMLDVFSSRSSSFSRPRNLGFQPDPVFKYVNLQQAQPDGFDIPGVGAAVPFVIMSDGPDVNGLIFPFPPVEPLVVYDPTNGTVSAGTIYNWGN